jgi:hypothetical protein
MPGTSHEIDANFFQLIHRLVSGSPREPGEDHRDQRRNPFECFQQIAPWDGEGFPEDSAFFAVRCRDLTCGGFSFFLPAEPTFERLVAAFGSSPAVIHVGAEVLHTVRVVLYPSGRVERAEQRTAASAEEANDPGSPMVLVGCRFLRRLRKPVVW